MTNCNFCSASLESILRVTVDWGDTVKVLLRGIAHTFPADSVKNLIRLSASPPNVRSLMDPSMKCSMV